MDMVSTVARGCVISGWQIPSTGVGLKRGRTRGAIRACVHGVAGRLNCRRSGLTRVVTCPNTEKVLLGSCSVS